MNTPFLLQGTLAELSTIFGLKKLSFDQLVSKIGESNFSEQIASEIFDVLFRTLEHRWHSRVRSKPPSLKNWRLEKVLSIEPSNPSAEVQLEKCFSRVSGEAWGNAIRTSSGVFGTYAGKKANIDLGWKQMDCMTFIELKWDSNSTSYAAFELIGYAMAWLQARTRSSEMGYLEYGELRDVLRFENTHWIVLAPQCYFDKQDKEHLSRFETWIDQNMRRFFRFKDDRLTPIFSFIGLPSSCPDFRVKKTVSLDVVREVESAIRQKRAVRGCSAIESTIP